MSLEDMVGVVGFTLGILIPIAFGIVLWIRHGFLVAVIGFLGLTFLMDAWFKWRNRRKL